MRIIILILLLVPLHVYSDQLEQSRIELEAKKKVNISNNLNLNSQESESFWNIYSDYERELGLLQKEYFDLIREFSSLYKKNSLSENSASNMLDKHFSIEERKVALKKSYRDRFQEIMPVKKVMRFYQNDNKMDSLIRCDIAKRLPLIESDMEF